MSFFNPCIHAKIDFTTVDGDEVCDLFGNEHKCEGCKLFKHDGISRGDYSKRDNHEGELQEYIPGYGFTWRPTW